MNDYKKTDNNYIIALCLMFLLAAFMLIPFIGLSDFYSKGEPREAVVAMSMLNEGNWILPINNGSDIAYKPPLFHWLIALFSLPAGHVSEYTSRLPSALALIILTVSTFGFFMRRKGALNASIAAMLLLTSFEVLRAGMACRVDMLLTMFIVGALYLLYKWYAGGLHGLPVLAVLALSGGVLTKGPVGLILPCLAMFIFMLLRGERFWSTVGRFVAIAILSLILPCLWYIAAYRQSGNVFLQLFMEENFARFAGKMSYESHVHPFTYNIFSLITGWLPWALLALTSLFVLPWNNFTSRVKTFHTGGIWTRFINFCRSCDQMSMFTWTSFLTILIFYCIPSSKRSTYLLPCYPFMAMLLTEYFSWVWQRSRRPTVIFTIIIASLSIILSLTFIAVRTGSVPETIFHGRHAYGNILMLRALSIGRMNIADYVLALLPAVAGITAMVMMKRKKYGENAVGTISFMLVFAIYISLNGFFQPRILNTQSSKPLAKRIEQTFNGEQMYQYINSPMMRFFGTDYYLNDRLRQFEVDRPAKGVLMIAERDTADFFTSHRNYAFTMAASTAKPVTELKNRIFFYRFNMKDRRP